MLYTLAFRQEVLRYADIHSPLTARQLYKLHKATLSSWIEDRNSIMALDSTKVRYYPIKRGQPGKSTSRTRYVFTRLARVNRACVKRRGYDIGEITALQLWHLAKRQHLRCALTCEKLTAKNISIDHVIPLALGGKDTLDNIQLVTGEVNRAKMALSTESFIQLCKQVTVCHS